MRSFTSDDDWVCRPHPPGEIARALIGGALTAAHRRGTTMWCETRVDGKVGPTGPEHRPGNRKPERDRFTVHFADGGVLRLFDKRRLGRVRLDPNLDAVGPDAETISREDFRTRVGRGHAAVKARLLDQSVLAGVGNLLADETLWQASISPTKPADELRPKDLDRLYDALESSLKAAIAHGGVHTGEVIPYRNADAACPRCGSHMLHGTVGGRSTWWCAKQQR